MMSHLIVASMDFSHINYDYQILLSTINFPNNEIYSAVFMLYMLVFRHISKSPYLLWHYIYNASWCEVSVYVSDWLGERLNIR